MDAEGCESCCLKIYQCQKFLKVYQRQKFKTYYDRLNVCNSFKAACLSNWLPFILVAIFILLLSFLCFVKALVIILVSHKWPLLYHAYNSTQNIVAILY